jgi:hypothetical protein
VSGGRVRLPGIGAALSQGAAAEDRGVHRNNLFAMAETMAVLQAELA